VWKCRSRRSPECQGSARQGKQRSPASLLPGPILVMGKPEQMSCLVLNDGRQACGKVACGHGSDQRVAKHERIVAVIQVPNVHVLRQTQERAILSEA